MRKRDHFSDEKYLKFLLSLHAEYLEKGFLRGLSAYTRTGNISNLITKVMLNQRIITKTGAKTYQWVGPAPDLTMVAGIKREQTLLTEASKGRGSKRASREPKLTPLSVIYDKVYEVIEISIKYGIPEQQRKSFVADILKVNR